MAPRARKAFQDYGVAIIAAGVAVILRLLLDPWLQHHLSLATLYGAIAFTVWYAGYGPALLTAILGYLACDFFFIDPRGVLDLSKQITWVGFLAYALSASLIIALGEAMHVAQRHLRKEMVRAQTSDAFHSLISDLTSDFTWTARVGPDGVMTLEWVSAGFARLLGYTFAELNTQGGWEMLVHPDDRAKAEATVRALLTGREVEGEIRNVAKDGRIVWLRFRGCPLMDAQGRITKLIGAVKSITEQKEAEERLKISEEKYRRIVETANEGIWMLDAEARITFANQRMGELLGYQPSELVGRTKWDLVFTEDQADMRRLFERRRQGLSEQVDVRFRHRDGHKLWMLMSARPLFDAHGRFAGALDMFSDVTARVEAELALRRSEERFRVLTEMVPSMIWMAAPDGAITYANRAWLRYCGLTPEQNARDWPTLVLHPEDYERCLTAWKYALEHGTEYEIEVRNRRHDGAYRWFVTRAVPLKDDDGRVTSWFGVTTDIHDQKEMHEQLREADRRKDEFLATLAHELRNPLAPIRNAVEMSRLAQGNAEVLERSRDIIERQLAQLVRLVDDLLDVSRITRGKLKLRKERVGLAAAVHSAVEASRPLIEESGHTLHLALPPEPVFLDADLTRLAQVFGNLLNNAARYTERGGHIWLEATANSDEVTVSIRDTGIGITPEQLPRLFEMFAQAAPALERSHGGLGIGLSLVRRLVELHGGRVVARSEGPGKGSEFLVHLPVAAAPTPAAEAGPPTANGAAALKARRLLIVDDNPDTAESLAQLLRLMGHETHTGNDGAQAVEAAEILRPDLAILDIGMPKLNGYEVARHIRSQPWGANMVLVALTGWGQEEDKRRAADAGFDHHLTKPVDPEILGKLLASV